MYRQFLSSLPILVFIWAVLGLICSLDSALDEWEHNIQISTDGHDNTTCLRNTSSPCQTLDYVLENLNSSTKVYIRNGVYSLEKNFNLSYLQKLAFVGQDSTVKIECSKGTGLQFRFCSSIVFDQLIFEGCGRLQYSAPFDSANSTLNESDQFYSGVSLTYCKDLVIKNCTLKNSPGIGLVLYDVGGSVNIVGSHFVNSTAKDYSKSLNFMKRGVLLHLTAFGSVFPFNDTTHRLYSDGNTYNFSHCTFRGNSYKADNKSQKSHEDSNGAGLIVYLCGSAKNNSLLIDTCQFLYNRATWGGGMFLEFHNQAEGNDIQIHDSEFTGNHAKYGGGGMRTGNDIQGDETLKLKENTIEHRRNKFFYNQAGLGGAVSHYGRTYPHILGKDKNWIRFTGCHFQGNTATIGSAISVALNNKNRWIELGPEIPYCTEITDCTVVNNVAKHTNLNKDHAQQVIGMGIVYSSKVPLILKGYNKFQNNCNTALLLDNAPLKVFNKTLFIKNRGYRGGALALYGEARLFMTELSYMYFGYNKAVEKGGAIFIRAPGPDVAPYKTRELRRHECSIGYENEEGKVVPLEDVRTWNTRLVFVNNSAPPWCGYSLYATTLQSCYLANESIGENSAFEWKHIFNYSRGLKDEISTDPVKIILKEQEWYVAPDEVFQPTIKLLDEKNSSVYGIVNIHVNGSGHPSIFPESLFLVQSNGEGNVSMIQELKLRGTTKSNFTIMISSVGGQTISKSFSQCFKSCHDGFEQKDGSTVCTCMSDNMKWHEGIANCSTDGKNVSLKTGYWGGKVEGKFVTYPCPQHYCQFDVNKSSFIYDKSKICAGNRCSDEYLCGICKNGYTVSLGSEKCVKTSTCKNFKISWGIPIFIVVTPLAILILLRINIDIFTSYLNSWLYFYQVLPFVLKAESVLKLDQVMQAILDLTSWRLPGVELSCFVSSLDNIGKLALNYLLPVYMLAILIIISLAARCCCNCYERTNVFRAISSILVLCYTNLTMISFNAVRWVKLQNDLYVLYIEGSITDKKSIPVGYYFLLIAAIIIIICFVFVFPVLLLFRPFFIRKVRFMTYFTPLYGIFQHCFRDNLGAFSAYYFICRIALLVLTASLSTPGPYKRCLTEILVILSLLIFVYVQPYRLDNHLRWLNTVDTVILTALCIMTVMSSSQNTEAAPLTIQGMQICIEILAWLPMIYLAGLIIIAIQHYCGCACRLFHPREEYQGLDDPTSTSGTPDS